MEVLEQTVEHLHAQQGQQGENVLKFEARLERFLFQKMGAFKTDFYFFYNKIVSHVQTSVREAKELFVLCVFIRNQFYLDWLILHCIVYRMSFGYRLIDM